MSCTCFVDGLFRKSTHEHVLGLKESHLKAQRLQLLLCFLEAHAVLSASVFALVLRFEAAR